MNPIFNKPKNKLEESAIDFLNKMQDPCDYNVYEIMAMFAQAELSKLSQHDVSSRRELLIAFMESLTTEDLTQIEIAEFENVADKFIGN